MSHGCGTLAGPSGFRSGTLAAASSNGKQHTLPRHPAHGVTDKLDITSHWKGDQPRGPSRLWGATKSTKLGGEERVDGPTCWSKGEYWNVDSNIRVWGEHETRRNAAGASHDVHRHDQKTRVVLEPVAGSGLQESRQCVSGVVGADSCFLEAWGFPLGLRDRQARPATLWKPPSSDECFRSTRSFERNVPRMAEFSRSLRRTATSPGSIHPPGVAGPKAEDVGGEAGEMVDPDEIALSKNGRAFGSRSCRFWERHGHVAAREAAKMACGIHSASSRSHADGHIIKENTDLNPASVYTLKYRKLGEDAFRRRVGATELTKRLDAASNAGAATQSLNAQRTLRLGAAGAAN